MLVFRINQGTKQRHNKKVVKNRNGQHSKHGQTEGSTDDVEVPVHRRKSSTPSAHISIAGFAGTSSYGPCTISLVYGTSVYDRT